MVDDRTDDEIRKDFADHVASTKDHWDRAMPSLRITEKEFSELLYQPYDFPKRFELGFRWKQRLGFGDDARLMIGEYIYIPDDLDSDECIQVRWRVPTII